MNQKNKERYFFYILLGVMAIICVAIFYPFLSIIFLGAALAVVLNPIFVALNESLKNKAPWLAAILACLFFLIIVGLPLFLLGRQVIREAHTVYLSLSESGGASHFIDLATEKISTLVPTLNSSEIQSHLGGVVSFITGGITNIFTSTFQTIVAILLTLLTIFYFLKDGAWWRSRLIALSPLEDRHDENIIKMLQGSVNGVIKGYLLIAILQGLALGLGLWVTGVPAPALWGALAGLASLIPTLGTALISIPAIIYLYLFSSGGAALGLIIWSAIIVGSMDNILNPIVVGKNIKLPPIMVLFSVLGGISLLGPLGVILGPLAVSLFYSLFKIYLKEF